MNTDSPEVTETNVDLSSFKDVAARAAVGAIVAVVVTQVATTLLNKGIAKVKARRANKLTNPEA